MKGKRAVVTGGSRGIGAVCSLLLAGCGADVCVGDRSRSVDADAMVRQLTAQGVRWHIRRTSARLSVRTR